MLAIVTVSLSYTVTISKLVQKRYFLAVLSEVALEVKLLFCLLIVLNSISCYNNYTTLLNYLFCICFILNSFSDFSIF